MPCLLLRIECSTLSDQGEDGNPFVLRPSALRLRLEEGRAWVRAELKGVVPSERPQLNTDPYRSTENFAGDLTGHVREPEISAGVAVGELLVVECYSNFFIRA